MRILGLSCFYHDAAACLVEDGRIVGAAAEEAFTRKKHDSGFPREAIRYVLSEAGLELSAGGVKGIDAVVFYDKPFKKFDRSIRSYVDRFPVGLGAFVRRLPNVINQELRIGKVLKDEIGYESTLLYSEHHLSHAASAFFCSGWRRPAS